MISEGLFLHFGTTASAAAGDFGGGVYQQIAIWILLFSAMVALTLKSPGYLSQLFAGQFKWVSIFLVVALASVPISESPRYSLGWAFKLSLVVLLLRALDSCLDRHEDVIRLFQVLLVGTLVAVIFKFVAPFLEPGSAFNGGRLEVIAGLSGYGGILLVLVFINFKLTKNPWLFAVAAFAVVMMLSAGGKAGILGSVLAVVAFFLFIKRVRYALVATLTLGVAFFIFIAVTPFGQYLERYSQSGQASTLTGRLDLWKAIWPEVLAHPILGHGYLASRFLSADVVGIFPEAGQTHNSLLEPLYNNGVPGLLVIVILNLIIVRNLVGAMKDDSDPKAHFLAAGTLALYVNLFIWGMFTATPFGGQPNGSFMIFLLIFIISGFFNRASTLAANRALE